MYCVIDWYHCLETFGLLSVPTTPEAYNLIWIIDLQKPHYVWLISEATSRLKMQILHASQSRAKLFPYTGHISPEMRQLISSYIFLEIAISMRLWRTQSFSWSSNCLVDLPGCRDFSQNNRIIDSATCCRHNRSTIRC